MTLAARSPFKPVCPGGAQPSWQHPIPTQPWLALPMWGPPCLVGVGGALMTSLLQGGGTAAGQPQRLTDTRQCRQCAGGGAPSADLLHVLQSVSQPVEPAKKGVVSTACWHQPLGVTAAACRQTCVCSVGRSRCRPLIMIWYRPSHPTWHPCADTHRHRISTQPAALVHLWSVVGPQVQFYDRHHIHLNSSCGASASTPQARCGGRCQLVSSGTTTNAVHIVTTDEALAFRMNVKM